MKKMLNIIVILGMVLFFVVPSFASNKYDCIVKNPGWNRMIQKFDTHLAPNRMYVNYLNCLVNKNDLNLLINGNNLNKDKRTFISENRKDFLKYLHTIIVIHVLSKLDPSPNDTQYIYITGVINDPRAQAATNGSEYEQEKMFFREWPLYATWENWRVDGYLSSVIDEQIDLIYNAYK